MTYSTRRRTRAAAVLLVPAMALAVVGCSSPGAGDGASAEDFYAGKQVRLIVTQPPGGGFDTFARWYAQCMPEHIPGEPTIVVENMPGAGNLIGMNYLYTAAERDGSVFGTGEGSVALQQLFGAEGVLFDMSEFLYLGMPDSAVSMVLVARADAGVTSMNELMDSSKSLKVGIPAPGSLLADPAIILADGLGANVQIVPGYEGTGPLALAVEQGEVDAFLIGDATLVAEHADKMSSGEWVALMHTATKGMEPLGVDLLGDAPSMESLASTDEERELVQAGVSSRAYHRPFFAPPGVPADRAAILKSAWEACNDDPEFIAAAEEGGREINPSSGETLTEVYTAFFNDTSADTVERLRELLISEP